MSIKITIIDELDENKIEEIYLNDEQYKKEIKYINNVKLLNDEDDIMGFADMFCIYKNLAGKKIGMVKSMMLKNSVIQDSLDKMGKDDSYKGKNIIIEIESCSWEEYENNSDIDVKFSFRTSFKKSITRYLTSRFRKAKDDDGKTSLTMDGYSHFGGEFECDVFEEIEV